MPLYDTILVVESLAFMPPIGKITYGTLISGGCNRRSYDPSEKHL